MRCTENFGWACLGTKIPNDLLSLYEIFCTKTAHSRTSSESVNIKTVVNFKNRGKIEECTDQDRTRTPRIRRNTGTFKEELRRKASRMEAKAKERFRDQKERDCTSP